MAKYQTILMSPPWAKRQKDQPETVKRYKLMPVTRNNADTGKTKKEVEHNA